MPSGRGADSGALGSLIGLVVEGSSGTHEVSVQLLPGALAATQTILVSEPGSGLALTAARSALSPLKGSIRFESTLLTGVGNGGCSVDSDPIPMGRKVRVRVTRSQEQCCITATLGYVWGV